MASWRIRFHDKWPHLASLYASTHNLDEDGKYPDPIMGQDNVFDPSEPYGAYRYYVQPSTRSEFSIEEPGYMHRTVYKDEESRSSDYTSGDSFRRGSTCRVLLCVFLVFSFIGVVVAAITLAVLLSQTPTPLPEKPAHIDVFESTASIYARDFNEKLLDNSTDEFKLLEEEFCKAIEQMFTDSDSPVKNTFGGCEVLEFINGSVQVRFRLKLSSKSPEGFKMDEKITQKLEEHFAKKVNEIGPWQKLRFNPGFLKKFLRIETVTTPAPPITTTKKMTTTAHVTTEIQTDLSTVSLTPGSTVVVGVTSGGPTTLIVTSKSPTTVEATSESLDVSTDKSEMRVTKPTTIASTTVKISTDEPPKISTEIEKIVETTTMKGDDILVHTTQSDLVRNITSKTEAVDIVTTIASTVTSAPSTVIQAVTNETGAVILDTTVRDGRTQETTKISNEETTTNIFDFSYYYNDTFETTEQSLTTIAKEPVTTQSPVTDGPKTSADISTLPAASSSVAITTDREHALSEGPATDSGVEDTVTEQQTASTVIQQKTQTSAAPEVVDISTEHVIVTQTHKTQNLTTKAAVRSTGGIDETTQPPIDIASSTAAEPKVVITDKVPSTVEDTTVKPELSTEQRSTELEVTIPINITEQDVITTIQTPDTSTGKTGIETSIDPFDTTLIPPKVTTAQEETQTERVETISTEKATKLETEQPPFESTVVVIEDTTEKPLVTESKISNVSFAESTTPSSTEASEIGLNVSTDTDVITESVKRTTESVQEIKITTYDQTTQKIDLQTSQESATTVLTTKHDQTTQKIDLQTSQESATTVLTTKHDQTTQKIDLQTSQESPTTVLTTTHDQTTQKIDLQTSQKSATTVLTTKHDQTSQKIDIQTSQEAATTMLKTEKVPETTSIASQTRASTTFESTSVGEISTESIISPKADKRVTDGPVVVENATKALKGVSDIVLLNSTDMYDYNTSDIYFYETTTSESWNFNDTTEISTSETKSPVTLHATTVAASEATEILVQTEQPLDGTTVQTTKSEEIKTQSVFHEKTTQSQDVGLTSTTLHSDLPVTKTESVASVSKAASVQQTDKQTTTGDIHVVGTTGTERTTTSEKPIITEAGTSVVKESTTESLVTDTVSSESVATDSGPTESLVTSTESPTVEVPSQILSTEAPPTESLITETSVAERIATKTEATVPIRTETAESIVTKALPGENTGTHEITTKGLITKAIPAESFATEIKRNISVTTESPLVTTDQTISSTFDQITTQSSSETITNLVNTTTVDQVNVTGQTTLVVSEVSKTDEVTPASESNETVFRTEISTVTSQPMKTESSVNSTAVDIETAYINTTTDFVITNETVTTDSSFNATDALEVSTTVGIQTTAGTTKSAEAAFMDEYGEAAFIEEYIPTSVNITEETSVISTSNDTQRDNTANMLQAATTTSLLDIENTTANATEMVTDNPVSERPRADNVTTVYDDVSATQFVDNETVSVTTRTPIDVNMNLTTMPYDNATGERQKVSESTFSVGTTFVTMTSTENVNDLPVTTEAILIEQNVTELPQTERRINESVTEIVNETVTIFDQNATSVNEISQNVTVSNLNTTLSVAVTEPMVKHETRVSNITTKSPTINESSTIDYNSTEYSYNDTDYIYYYYNDTTATPILNVTETSQRMNVIDNATDTTQKMLDETVSNETQTVTDSSVVTKVEGQNVTETTTLLYDFVTDNTTQSVTKALP